MPINDSVTLSVSLLNILSAWESGRPFIAKQTASIPSEGPALLHLHQHLIRMLVHMVSQILLRFKGHRWPVPFFNRHLDQSQSQLAGTGWEGSFLCLIGVVIHQKHRSQRSARHRCFVWLFPGISSCHGSPSLCHGSGFTFYMASL